VNTERYHFSIKTSLCALRKQLLVLLFWGLLNNYLLSSGLTQTISEVNVTSPSQVVDTSILGTYSAINEIVPLVITYFSKGRNRQ
jgi:hypothetical protein